jgi:hypothetical protein
MKGLEEFLPESPENAVEGAGSRRVRPHMLEEREAAIKLEDGTLIKGKINLFAEPAQENHDLYLKHSDDLGTYYRRISDIFTRGSHPFIVVYDVIVEGQIGRVLIINKNKILWVSPED